MELYILRHGVAADFGPAGSGDAGRPLTDEGISKMQLQAAGLKRLELTLDYLFCSPLVRTQQTAEIIGQALGIEAQIAAPLAPGCDLNKLRTVLAGISGGKRIMVVGHEPDCGELTSQLTGGSRFLFKKGGLARIDLPVIAAGAGVLTWYLPPRVQRLIGDQT